MGGAEPLGAVIALVDTIRPEALLFGESTGRVVVSGEDDAALLALAAEHRVPARKIGETGGESLRVTSAEGAEWIDLQVEVLLERWTSGIPAQLEED